MKLYNLVLVSILLLVIIDCSEGWRRRRRRRRAPTPVNCQVGSWTNWGACSVSCGSGTQARTRAVTVSPANGGAGCPATTEYKSCNIQKQNCQVSSWSFWGTCSKSCGAGTQSRSRTITVSPANCGSACPPLQDSKACTGIQCPAHCQVSAWTTWSDCSVSCGAGSHSRTRSITIHPVHGGDSCPALTEHDACQVPQIHCAVSSWSSWGTCSESCGPGAQSRSRKVTISPANCGSACPPLHDSRGCTGLQCPVDCQVSSWTTWSDCSVSCGNGTHSRTRNITTHPVHGGKGCPATTEHGACQVPQIDCIVSSWSNWGTCSESCGQGEQTRTRTVTVNPAYCGSACPPLQDRKGCTGIQCAVHCQVSSWSQWGECSVTCGTGSTTRTREVKIHPVHGGENCPDLVDEKECSLPQQDCEVTAWSSWGLCSSTCGEGSHIRTRSITQESANCGDTCPDLLESKPCENPLCEADCDEEKLPNVEEMGRAFDVTTLLKTVSVLDNSKNNGQCTEVYDKYKDVNLEVPYNIESYTPEEEEITSFEVKSEESLAAILGKLQKKVQGKHDYVGTSVQLSEIHEAVPYAAAGNNSQYEKLIHGSYDTEYKYFSVRAVKLLGKFRLRNHGLILNSDFIANLGHLPTEYVEKHYIAILQNYGTHFFTKGSVGGKYESIYAYKKSDLKASGLSDLEQRKCLENEARFELLGADVSIVDARCSNMGKSRTLFTNAAKRSFSFVSGGDPAITASLTINSGKEQFTKWTNSILSNPAILNYKISPISELVGSSVSHGNEKKANLERAILQYLEKYNPSSCTELVCHNGAMQVVNQAKHCLCVCTKGWHGSKCDQSK